MEFEKEYLERIFWDDAEDATRVSEYDWQVDHKHEHCDVVFKYEPDGKHYMFTYFRSGNYWNGYEYEIWDADVVEVELKEVVVQKWMEVK